MVKGQQEASAGRHDHSCSLWAAYFFASASALCIGAQVGQPLSIDTVDYNEADTASDLAEEATMATDKKLFPISEETRRSTTGSQGRGVPSKWSC